MKNSQKFLIVTALLGIVAFLVVGGVYIYENKKIEAIPPSTVSNVTNSGSNDSSLSDTKLLTTKDTVTKEGPGGLSIKVPKDIAGYFSEETKTFPNPYVGTEFKMSFYQDRVKAYFEPKNLWPSSAQIFITIGEQKYGEDSRCNSSKYISDVISKKTYSINGYSFTQINGYDKEKGDSNIAIFNITNKDTCRYIRFSVQSVSESYMRIMATENPNEDQGQVELMIKNTKITQEYLNNLIIQISDTISVK